MSGASGELQQPGMSSCETQPYRFILIGPLSLLFHWLSHSLEELEINLKNYQIG